MPEFSFSEKVRFKATAILVGERIDLRTLENLDKLASVPFTVAVRDGGMAVLFRYGAVVLFDVDSLEQAEFLNRLSSMVSQSYAKPELETVEIRIDAEGREGMDGNTIVLQDASVERLQLVADILGKSVALAQYESELTRSFDRIEPFAVNLVQKGRISRRANELLRHIGGALLSEQKMAGRVEISDKPDLLWERPELERLFNRLSDEFEIRERHLALERKLKLIARTAQTVHSFLQERRSLRVEWYIVILIVVEILLTLYELFFIGH